MKKNSLIDMNIPKLIKMFFIFGFILWMVFISFYIVSAGERGILITLGNPSMNPAIEGIHFKIPLIQTVVIMDIKTQKYEAEATSASKDLQDVKTKIATNYHLLSSSVPIIYKEIGIDYSDKIIMPLEQEVVKATTAKFTAEELITKREEVRNEIKKLFAERLLSKGIIVEEISITNFEFSPTFTQAIEAKVTAEQNALKEQNNLQVVQFQAQQKVEQAKGEAEAVKIINEQLLKSPQYINYMTIQKWDGKMPLALGSGSLLSISGEKNLST